VKNHHHNHPIHPAPPTHLEIAERAGELWLEYGQPENRDEAIWLEAERQLIANKTDFTANSPQTALR